MKKTVIVCGLLCLLSAVNVFAGNPVSVKSGDISVLKNQSNAILEIDYSNTKVDNKETLDEYLKRRGDDFVKDWPKDKETAANYFIGRFNNKNKGMQLLMEPATNANYKIVIHVNNLDMGNGGSTFNPYASPKAGGVIMTGTVDIVDMKTNKIVCTLTVDEVKGLGHVSETTRLGLMYFELATIICKLSK